VFGELRNSQAGRGRLANLEQDPRSDVWGGKVGYLFFLEGDASDPIPNWRRRPLSFSAPSSQRQR